MVLCKRCWRKFNQLKCKSQLQFRAEGIKPDDRINNELLIINLAAVVGRRNSTACTKPSAVAGYAVGQFSVHNSATKICYVLLVRLQPKPKSAWRSLFSFSTYFVLWFFNLAIVSGGLLSKSKHQDTTKYFNQNRDNKICSTTQPQRFLQHISVDTVFKVQAKEMLQF